MNHLDVDHLLGRRYVSDFRIISIGSGRLGVKDDPEREVKLRINGGDATISFGELRQAIETGFVVEASESDVRRAH